MHLFEFAQEYPDDGMAVFKRAEASEALREAEKASADYISMPRNSVREPVGRGSWT